MDTQQFLREHRVPFEVVSHTPTFDASHLAEAVHAPGREVAKTVLVRANHDYRYVVAVLPSTHMVDLDVLSQALGGATLELATELEIGQRCPDCEFGVLPPFGSQYGAETIVDTSLTKDEQIVFEGNTHGEAIRMKYHDFYEVEHPRVAQFARRA
ncbi:MAG: YbaK/EbsC family protein [Planctomycetia bacterium]|nr:YbaK/EbsC family protein [Planctomycetia bacterium]